MGSTDPCKYKTRDSQVWLLRNLKLLQQRTPNLLVQEHKSSPATDTEPSRSMVKSQLRLPSLHAALVTKKPLLSLLLHHWNPQQHHLQRATPQRVPTSCLSLYLLLCCTLFLVVHSSAHLVALALILVTIGHSGSKDQMPTAMATKKLLILLQGVGCLSYQALAQEQASRMREDLTKPHQGPMHQQRV